MNKEIKDCSPEWMMDLNGEWQLICDNPNCLCNTKKIKGANNENN